MVNFDKGLKHLKTQERIFLTGKSGTGKSYLTNKLKEHKTLELDSVVLRMMKKYNMNRQDIFTKVYKNKGNKTLMNDFIKRVKSFIKRNHKYKILIEGAISDPKLITEIFGNNFIIVFLYPSCPKKYKKRLMERYQQNPTSLPFTISNPKQLDKELDKITKEMIIASNKRYDTFKKHFQIYKIIV